MLPSGKIGQIVFPGQTMLEGVDPPGTHQHSTIHSTKKDIQRLNVFFYRLAGHLIYGTTLIIRFNAGVSIYASHTMQSVSSAFSTIVQVNVSPAFNPALAKSQ